VRGMRSRGFLLTLLAERALGDSFRLVVSWRSADRVDIYCLGFLVFSIAAAGGLRILAEVLKVHGDSQALVRTSAHAIRNLTLNCPENVLLSKQLGIPKLLLLRTSGASEATRIQLLLTLGHITRCDEELQKQFGNDVDYCVPIAKIVKDAPDSEKLSELSVEMLSVVANGRNEEILNMLGESAFISVLLKRQDRK